MSPSDPAYRPAVLLRWVQGGARRLLNRASRHMSGLFVAAILIGIAAALINEGLHGLLDTTRNLQILSRTIPSPLLADIVVVLIPVAGMAILLGMERVFPGEIGGYGLPHFLELVNVQGASIKSKWIALKSAAASITIGMGLSAGLEGPLVQIGGAIGSAVGRPMSLATGRLRVLIACGAAAMIATTFDAPLASVLFAQEIVLVGSFELATFSLVVVSAGVAVTVGRLVFAGHRLIQVPAVAFPVNHELFLHLVVGALIGVIAVFYSHAIFRARRELRPDGTRAGWTRSLLVALFIGVAGLLIPGVAGDGLSTANRVLAGTIPLYLLGAIILLKIVATAATLGAGGAGGIFAPAVLIGSAAGYGAAQIFQSLSPGLIVQPADYALVGICAMLGATTHAPLTSIFLLSELTRSPEVAFQGMVGVAAAILASRVLSPETVETMELRQRGIDIHATLVERIMSGMKVRGIMRPDVQIVPPEMPILEFAHYAAATYHKYFPVLMGGRLLGIVTLDDLGPILDEPEQWKTLFVVDLLRAGPAVYVGPEDDLATAEELFKTHGFEQIPVMEEVPASEGGGMRAVGLLHHTDMLQAAARRKLSMELPR